MKDKSSEVIAVIIDSVHTIQTKGNETMAFITISDYSGTTEAVVFPKIYKEFRELIMPDRCIAVKVTVNTRNDEKSFLIDRVKGL